MFHITAVLEGHILVADRTVNNDWHIKINETLSGKTRECVWSDEELSATLALAVNSSYEAPYEELIYRIAEGAALKMEPSTEGLSEEQAHTIRHMFRLIP